MSWKQSGSLSLLCNVYLWSSGRPTALRASAKCNAATAPTFVISRKERSKSGSQEPVRARVSSGQAPRWDRGERAHRAARRRLRSPMESSHGPRDLVIPVNDSILGVAVSLEALPLDEADVLQVLQAENAPLGLWLDFARAYLQQGMEEQGRRVLEDGCSPGAPPAAAPAPASPRVLLTPPRPPPRG